MPRPLQGVLPIVQTPFTDEDRIDAATLAKTIEWGLSVGADGFGTGMVSETFRLTTDERRQLTEHLVTAVARRAAVFVAVGAESTRAAVEFTVHAESVGCDAVMAIPPMTTRLSESAVVDHFSAIADSVTIPIIVQDASAYVGQPIPHRVYVQLLDRYGNEKILFKPEASPNGPNLSALRDITAGRAKIFEGSGGVFFVDSFRRGITGTMPGMELLDGMVALWSAMKQGDDSAAYSLSFPISGIVSLQLQAGLDGFLAIEKHVLHCRGLIPNQRRRRPYSWDLDAETAAEVDRLFDRLQSALAAFRS
jgi:4-hydroxy-tetrahydrodipicolinate synthase